MRGATHPGLSSGPLSPLFRLAPDWVYPASLVALRSGGLLPRLFTLTTSHPAAVLSCLKEYRRGGMFSVTLSVASDLRPKRPFLRKESCPTVSGLSSPFPLWERERTPASTKAMFNKSSHHLCESKSILKSLFELPEGGLEPPRRYRQRILSPQRLPFRHSGFSDSLPLLLDKRSIPNVTA